MRGMGQPSTPQAKSAAVLSSPIREISQDTAPSLPVKNDVRPIYVKALNKLRADSTHASALNCREYLECALGAGFNRAVLPLVIYDGLDEQSVSDQQARYITSLDIGNSSSLQRTILFVDACGMLPCLGKLLREAFQVAAHIGPDIVLLQPSYDDHDLPQMASAICNYLLGNRTAFLWILIPYSTNSLLFKQNRSSLLPEDVDRLKHAKPTTSNEKVHSQAWQFWKRLQTACNYVANLSACLLIEKEHIYVPDVVAKLDGNGDDVQFDTPQCVMDEQYCEAECCIGRWLGESCDAIMLQADDLLQGDGWKSGGKAARDQHYHRIIQKLSGGSAHMILNMDSVVRQRRCGIAGELKNPASTPNKKLLPVPATSDIANEFSALYIFARELHTSSDRFNIAFPRDPPGFQIGYENQVQMPLQPMAENLADAVYEVFEFDPVKYFKYQQALEMAMRELKSPASRLCVADTIRVVVAGAGRGPLVDRTIEAAVNVGIKQLVIIVIEKNLGAYHTLQRRLATDWQKSKILQASQDRVSQRMKPFFASSVSAGVMEDVTIELLNIDMRRFSAKPKSIDIIVSELLGSFACNELSPECLRGLERFLQPSGVMIPQEYSALLRPVMANKLWKTLYRDNDAANSKLDCMSVVRLHRYFMLCDSSVPAFVYHHPDIDAAAAAAAGDNNGNISDNIIDSVVEADVEVGFEASCDAELDGFVGSFDCLLYQTRRDLSDGDDRIENGNFDPISDTSVVLSTVPEHATDLLVSWFPMFLPLRQPVLVNKGDTIRLYIERKRGPGRVWYSWCLLSPRTTPMQNVGGMAYHIGLYV